MRLIGFIVIFLMGQTLSYADWILTEKSTGILLIYQSHATRDQLIASGLSSGYSESDLEAKEVTFEEWLVIREEEIVKPEKDRKIAKEASRKIKENSIRAKLGLTAAEFQMLKESLE